MKLKTDSIRPLKYFIHRSLVLSLYRDFMRTCRSLLPNQSLRMDVENQIRVQFRKHKEVKDDTIYPSLISQGRAGLKQVQNLVDSTSYTSNTIPLWKEKALGKDEEDQQHDIKGRIGTGWPWKKVQEERC